MSKFVTPIFHKWQLRPAWKNPGPVFRYMNSLTIRYYPHSPNVTSITEFYKRVNTRQQLLHTERDFELKVDVAPFGTKAAVLVQYRNGDKLELCAEENNCDELLYKLMAKRFEMEDQMEYAETHTLLTLEEEALMVGGAKRDDKGGKGGKAPVKGKAPAKPAAKGGKKK